MIYQRPDELYHYGVKGMRWGVRRYQNEDGSLKAAGERHRAQREGGSYSGGGSSGGSSKKADRRRKLKRALGVTLGAAAAGAAAYYGGKKLGSHLVNKYYGKNAKFTNAAGKFANSVDKYGLGAKNRIASKYQDARSGLKNSKFGRRVATEKFKAGYLGKKGYAKDVLGRAREGAVNKAYWLQEKGSLYGQKAKSGLKSAPTTAKNLKNKAKIKYYLGKTDYYLNGGARGLANRTGNRIKNVAAKAGSGAVNKAYWLQEKSSLYGQKAKSRLSSAASNYRSARDERRLVGSNLGSKARKAREGAVNKAYWLQEKGSLYGQKAVNAARSAYDRRKRRRQANRATLSRF